MFGLKIATGLSILSANVDEEITFLKQIGIDTVSISLRPGFSSPENQPTGQQPVLRTKGDLIQTLAAAVKLTKEAGLKVNEISFDITNTLLGKAEGSRELDTAAELIKAAGKASIPLIWVWPLGIRQGPMGVPGRYNRAHRGGYVMSAFSVKLMKEELAKRDVNSRWAHHFKENVTSEGYFTNLVKALQQIVPIAEEAGVKLMLHTDDPPVPDTENLLQGL